GAGGEIGDQVEQFVSGTDKAVEARLFQTHLVEEFPRFLVRKLGHFRLDGGGDDYGPGTLRLGHVLDGLRVLVAGSRVCLRDVADIENRLRGEKVETLQNCQVFRGDAVEQKARRL